MHKSDHYLPRSKIHSVRVGVGLLYLCVIKYLHFGGQKDEVFNCFTHRNTLLRCVCFQGAVCRCFNANVYIPLLYRLLRCLRCLVFAHLFCFACNIRPLCAIAHIIGQKKTPSVSICCVNFPACTSSTHKRCRAAVVIPSGRTAHIPHTFAVFLWVMEAVMLNHCANVGCLVERLPNRLRGFARSRRGWRVALRCRLWCRW